MKSVKTILNRLPTSGDFAKAEILFPNRQMWCCALFLSATKSAAHGRRVRPQNFSAVDEYERSIPMPTGKWRQRILLVETENPV